jgi:hypothetical protein
MLSLKTTFKINPIQRKRIIPKVIPNNAILFDYVDAYLKYLCPNSACIDNLIVPNVTEQVRILQELSKIQTECNTHDLDGIFMRLIMIHDQTNIDILKNTLEIYDNSKNLITEIIRYSSMIQILSPDDMIL